MMAFLVDPVMEDLESHKLEELVSKGSEVMDGPIHVHIPEEQGAELLPLDMLNLRLG